MLSLRRRWRDTCASCRHALKGTRMRVQPRNQANDAGNAVELTK
jgi:hypothetical protein